MATFEHFLYSDTDYSAFATITARGPRLATILLRYSRKDFEGDRQILALRHPPRRFFYNLAELHSGRTRRRAVCFVLFQLSAFHVGDVARLLEDRLFAYLTIPVRTALAMGTGVEIVVNLSVTSHWGSEPSSFVDEGVGGGGGFGGVPASSDSIEKLELVKYERGGINGGDNKGCTICFEDYQVEEELSKMPCRHVFHSRCISKWLEMSRLCPLCRLALPADA